MSQFEADHLSELLSLLAHDLRNPLSALLTNINFVKSMLKNVEPDVDDALSDSALSCVVLSQFIGNLDVVAGGLLDSPLPRRPTAARQAATEAVARLKLQSASMAIEVQISPGQHAPQLMVEPSFFGRALDNLLANSLQYAPPKSQVKIECVARRDRGYLLVADEGPAVPREYREQVLTGRGQTIAKQIFEARYGRGIGLFCASQAARIAGAEVSVSERAGRSILEISAPLAP